MFCPHCGLQTPDNARFCLNCGAPLSQEGAQTVQPAPRRHLGLWILVGVLAAIALGLGIYLLLMPDPAPAPAPVIPTETPAPAPTAEAALPIPSPSPTTEIIVITPPPPTPTPTPSVPTAVKVFFYDKELDEFTETVGNTLMLAAGVYPEDDFCNAMIQWTVSDPSVIKLEPAAYGRTCDVTILKHQTGPVTLTVSCCGAKKDVLVYTKPAPSPTPASGSVALEGQLLYRINIFLSNFSEQQIKSFTTATAADDYLIRFVELYCKINHNSLITYLAGEECLSLADAKLYYTRFFNKSLDPYEGATYMLDAWNSYRYSGGYFRFPAADGGSFNRFTVAYEMNANGDGTYTVSFQVFELDINEYWDKGMDNALYGLSNDEVASLVWSNRVKPVQGGTAVVRDYKFGGVDTYQILSYDVWDIIF